MDRVVFRESYLHLSYQDGGPVQLGNYRYPTGAFACFFELFSYCIVFSTPQTPLNG